MESVERERQARRMRVAILMVQAGLLAGLSACGGSGDDTPVAAGPPSAFGAGPASAPSAGSASTTPAPSPAATSQAPTPAPTPAPSPQSTPSPAPGPSAPAPSSAPAPAPGAPLGTLPKSFGAVIVASTGQAGRPGSNAAGQVAYTVPDPLNPRARFFDGSASREITSEPARAVTINASGQVAGQLLMASGGTRAFFWDAATGALQSIDVQPGTESLVQGMNDAGEVVGALARQNLPAAFLWRPGSAPQGLPSLPAANGVLPLSTALFINASGTAAGISAVDVGRVHAALWVPGAAVVDLGTLGGAQAQPAALNNAGQVAGVSDTAAGARHAFLWSAAAGLQDLGTLGGMNSAATALNEAGAVAGTSDTSAGPRAFRWQAGAMVSLGDLGGASSSATAINAAGQVGGTALAADGSPRAFLWSPEDGMVDLNMRVAGSGIPLLQTVIALHADGTVLASTGAGLVLLRPQSG